MGIQKPEWFRMDPAKFFSDAQVDAMSTLELGACLRLLGRQWIDGHVPDDLRVLARLCRLDDTAMREAWETLSVFFPIVAPGKRANRYMWIEREKVIADLERKSDEGTRAARKRWDEARKRNASSSAVPNAEANGSANAAPNGSPIPEPMQDQTRPDQSRADSQDATAMPDPSSKFNRTEVAQILCQHSGWSGRDMIWALEEAIDFQAKRMPESELQEVGEWLLNAYSNYKADKGKFAVTPQKFFQQGLYCSVPIRLEAKTSVLIDNPATRALAQMESA